MANQLRFPLSDEVTGTERYPVPVGTKDTNALSVVPESDSVLVPYHFAKTSMIPLVPAVPLTGEGNAGTTSLGSPRSSAALTLRSQRTERWAGDPTESALVRTSETPNSETRSRPAPSARVRRGDRVRAYQGAHADGHVTLTRGGYEKPLPYAAELRRAIARAAKSGTTEWPPVKAPWLDAPDGERRFDSRLRLSRNIGDGIVVQWACAEGGETYAVVTAIDGGWEERWKIATRDVIPNGSVTVFGALRADKHRAAPRRRK